MDIEEKDHRLEQLKQALAAMDNTPQPVPQSAQTWDTISYDSIPSLTTIDLSALNLESMASISPGGFWNNSPTTTNSSTVYTIGGGGGGSGQVYAGMHANTSIGIGGGWSNQTQGKVKVAADDIEINGKSLLQTLDRIEQQLGILDCDEKLEVEWQNLRELGEQYRKMKQHIEDKMKTFETLK